MLWLPSTITIVTRPDNPILIEWSTNLQILVGSGTPPTIVTYISINKRDNSRHPHRLLPPYESRDAIFVNIYVYGYGKPTCPNRYSMSKITISFSKLLETQHQQSGHVQLHPQPLALLWGHRHPHEEHAWALHLQYRGNNRWRSLLPQATSTIDQQGYNVRMCCMENRGICHAPKWDPHIGAMG